MALRKIEILVSIISLSLSLNLYATSYYISPDGVDDNSGLTPKKSLASIEYAFDLAKAGDTLLLLPGKYYQQNLIKNKHGLPDQPITIISAAKNPVEFAEIDRQSLPSSVANNEGFVFENCSWINIENIVFRNCWASVIYLRHSNYISIRGCHFTTGKRVIHAVGNGTHHVLVENCYIQHPDEVWRGWSWESLHHGKVGYYNGALLHPNQSGGGHVMRGNTIINLFNAFRTRPISIKEDGNTEIYNNILTNIRDNEFEPETWAWNMHYYHNRHVNIHKMFSIDGVKGGNIYIYGNTYTQTTDPWAIEEVSGIFKYKTGPITYPTYAFNNSYYTEAQVMKRGEASNHLLKHYNNAYYFFDGENRFRISDWRKGYDFDYDCINQDWTANIYNHQQEKNGLKLTDPQFVNGLEGDFRLQKGSPCIDAGKTIQFTEFQWTQSYDGSAPDIGAFENGKLVEGPPFRFIPSPEGALYAERPRITRHKIESNKLWLYFSAPLATQSITNEDITVFQNGKKQSVNKISFPNNNYEMLISLNQALSSEALSIHFENKPFGENGLPLTYWASTIPIGQKITSAPDLSSIDIQFNPPIEVPDFSQVKMEVMLNSEINDSKVVLTHDQPMAKEFVNHISIYSHNGEELGSIYEGIFEGNKITYPFKNFEFQFAPGQYIAKTRVGKQIFTQHFEIK